MSKILIIEDDSEIAMLERDYLEIEGFETTVIADGEAAAEEALRGGYDLLLLDLMLPGLDDFSACHALRKALDTPILMVTARREDIDKIRGLDIVIVTTAKTDEEARELLSLMGAPFRR